MHHVRHRARRLGDETLDRVRQRVHARERGESARHRAHHVRIDERNDRDVVRIDADELAFLLDIRDDVVDRHFRRRAGGRRNGENRQALVLRRRDALERTDVRELRIRHDDTDALCRVHRAAAANGDDAVGLRRLRRLHAVLHIRNRRIRLDLGVDRELHFRLLEEIRHLLRDTELDEVGIGKDDRLLQSARRELRDNRLDRASAMIRGFVENNAVYHFSHSFGFENCPYYSKNAAEWPRRKHHKTKLRLNAVCQSGESSESGETAESKTHTGRLIKWQH